MKKYSGRKRYFARKIWDYAIVVVLLLVLFFVWQLYRGPISVPFLKPYIITALNQNPETSQVTVGDVNIELVRSIKPIKIIARDVVYTQNDDKIKMNAPSVSVSFSIKALLHGVIAPSSIEITTPSLNIFTNYGVSAKDKASEITAKQIDYYVDSFEDFIKRFNSPDNSYAESYINDINIMDAEIEYHEVDMGRKWVLTDVDYSFERNINSIDSDINGFLDLRDKYVTFGVAGSYRPSSNQLGLQVYFADLVPADIVASYAVNTIKKDIYEINLPLNGTISTVVNFNQFAENRQDLITAFDSSIEKINFELEGGAGNILFSAEDSESSYKISSFKLKGEAEGGLDKVSVKGAGFNLGEQAVSLNVDVSGWGKYLLRGEVNDLKVVLTTEIDKLKLDDLYVYWPRYIAPEAWDWCKDSIFGGDAERAAFRFEFGYDETTHKFGFLDLSGGADIVDSNLRYINSMPVVKGVYGQFKVHKNSLEVFADKAFSDGIILENGYVRIYDLDKYNNFIEIKLVSDSEIKNALDLIDHEPLNLTTEMGLQSLKVEGSTHTSLDLNFELKKDLDYDDVKVKVEAELKDVMIPKIINDKPIKAPNLILKVDNAGMEISGNAEYEGIPLDLTWKEEFVSAQKAKSVFNLKFKANEAVFQKFGINYSMLKSPDFIGDAAVEALAVLDRSGKMSVDVIADLRNSEYNYGFIGFYKPLTQDARLSARVNLKDGIVTDIPNFALSKTDFLLTGKIDLDKGQIRIIDIDSIKGSKTAARAKIELPADANKSIKVNISGSSYDLSEFFEARENAAKADAKDEKQEDADYDAIPNIDINIAVNSLWTNPDVSVTNFAGSAKIVKGIGLNEAHLIGNYDNNREMNLKVDYDPRPNDEHLLAISTNHAGNTLRFLRIYDSMRGGNMQINARRGADREFVGHAKIRDFSLYDTPALAKLLTVASFTGLVDLLRGEGMTFSHFDAPFRLNNGILTITDAKTYGNVMGITFSGAYNMYNDNLTFDGTFAPAYGLNTMIGKIPLLGNLLAGRDGTVFVANYSITGNATDPDISLNPLSALSPSSLKEALASVFGEQE